MPATKTVSQPKARASRDEHTSAKVLPDPKESARSKTAAAIPRPNPSDSPTRLEDASARVLTKPNRVARSKKTASANGSAKPMNAPSRLDELEVTTPARDNANPRFEPRAGYLELRLNALMLADAQHARIQCENRAKRGPVDPALYKTQLDAMLTAEKVLKKLLLKAYRKHVDKPIRHWQAANIGIGDHTLALLIGYTGHPRIATPHHWEGSGEKRILVPDEPYERSISQLWAYCGHGDPNRIKRSGMTAAEAMALGNPVAKKTVHLMAESCMKQKDKGGKYRAIYEETKARYAGQLHDKPCVRCGPSGKPALAGSPWSDAHKHASALRLTGKEILRDLWIAAVPS